MTGAEQHDDPPALAEHFGYRAVAEALYGGAVVCFLYPPPVKMPPAQLARRGEGA